MSLLCPQQNTLQETANGLTRKVDLVISGSRRMGPAIVRRIAKEGTNAAIGYAVSTFFWSIFDHVVRNLHYFIR